MALHPEFPASHFKEGATAEQIQHSFPSVSLHDIYGAIFSYLEHSEEVERYFASRETEAHEIEGRNCH